MPRRRLDWSWGPGHGPVLGALNAAGAACAVTMVGDLLHRGDLLWLDPAPSVPWWTLGAGAAAAAVATGVAAWEFAPPRVLCYRAACWLGAGLWSAWSIATTSPWSLPSVATLITGSVAAAGIGLAFARADRREQQRIERARRALEAKARPAKPRLLASEHERLAAEWEARIARVCRIEVTVRNVELWPGDPRPGFTVDADLPLGGSTWRDIQAHEDALAADARLPEGCGVEVGPGVDRGAVLIRVSVRDALAEDIPYPRDGYPHESINEPRLIGLWRDGSEARFPLRQEVVLAVGPTGSGKTTFLNTLVAEHLKCVDVIPCVIDFNGGSLALPWLLPWRQSPDACPRPAISWVADTPDKALEMTEALLKIAKDRKASYAHLKLASNTTLLPISAELPQWTVFVDEVAEILGEAAQRDPTRRRVADNLMELQRIGRESGVRLVIGALGATNAVLSDRAVKIHAKVKVAMALLPTDEQFYLFDVSKLPTEDLSHPGCARIMWGAAAPRAGKIPHLLPEQIAEIAVATSDRRPDPDARALEILGDTWTRRWERSAELLALLDAGAEAIEALQRGEPVSAVTGVARASTVQRGSDVESSEPVPGLSQALADLEAARQRMREAMEQADGGAGGEANEAALGDAEKVATPDVATLNEMLSQPGPQPRERMRQMVAEAGQNGITPGQVHARLRAEGYPTTLQTVITWMREDAAAGIIRQPGGPRTPYFPA